MANNENITKLINSVESGDMVDASASFQAAMVDKQKEAIDQKRLDIQMNWMEKGTDEVQGTS